MATAAWSSASWTSLIALVALVLLSPLLLGIAWAVKQ